MNKAFFFAEGVNFFDLTMKEKLDEYDAPPWSPNNEQLSPIKSSATPFRDALETSTEIESFNTCKLEFKSLELIEEEEESSIESTPEKTVKASLPPTPKVRKPINVILSRIRKIDFDLPEDYELQVKSTTVVNGDSDEEAVNETVV